MTDHSLKQWRRVLEVIESYAALGEKTLIDGTRLVGHVPHVAPLAYLHQLGEPLGGLDASRVQMEARRPMPDEFRWFLTEASNGLSLFAEIEVYGLRRDRWPFPAGDANRLSNLPGFVVGSYREDGSRVTILEDARICWVPEDSSEAARYWPDFITWLAEESDRLGQRFDADGKELDDDPKTPEPARPAIAAEASLRSELPAGADEWSTRIPDDVDGLAFLTGDELFLEPSHPRWLVIAADELVGDLVMVDLQHPRKRVLAAWHDAVEETVRPISGSLDGFLAALAAFRNQGPAGILAVDSEADIEFWEDLLNE